MITAELSPGSWRPVEILQWTASGKVQVRHGRDVAGQRIFNCYTAVPAMKLIHAGGRKVLVRALARLPREAARGEAA